VRGRFWLLLGVAIGLAVSLGRLPFLAGAGRALADTSLHMVAGAARRLLAGAASSGAPRRAVLGVAGLLAVVLPGLTALLLVIAARATIRVRGLLAAVLAVLGVCSFFYEPGIRAWGALVLGLTLATLAVAVSGPVLVAPFVAAATLIGAQFLPTLFRSGRVAQEALSAVHVALFGAPATPAWLQVLMFGLAVLPFLLAARLALRA